MTPMVVTLHVFAVFFITVWSSMWLIHLLAILYGKFRLHNRNVISNYESYPGISIIKPLMGTDAHLISNLETFFTMDYPQYEILFCIEDKNDSAIGTVKALIERYSAIPAKLLIGGSTVGVNPKINNMNGAYETSTYNLILISDSGIRMKPDTLKDMVDCLSERTGLVHQLPFVCDRPGFAATLEKVYFGTVLSRAYLVSDFLTFNCHTGMSTLFRKNVLQEIGGLKTLGCYLAEDFFMAKFFLQKGWRIAISSQPAMQNLGDCDVDNFQKRLARWIKLRVTMQPIILLFEPLSECLVLGLCAAWSLNFLFQCDPFVIYLLHVLFWFQFDYILFSVVQNSPLPFNKLHFITGWLLRECLAPYIFFRAVFQPTVKWRTRSFKLLWGGRVLEVNTQLNA